MAITVTLLALRTGVRERTDQVASDQASNTWLNYLINRGMRHYVRQVIAADRDFYVLETSINTTSGTYEYTLPAGFLGLRGVDRVEGNDRTSLKSFNWVDRNKYRRTSTPYPRYRWLRGGRDGSGVRLQFASDPGTTTAGYLAHYLGVPADLSADGDTLDDILGLSDYVEVYASACVQERFDEREHAASLRAELAVMEAAIIQTVKLRTSDGSARWGNASSDYDDFEVLPWPT